MLIHIGLPFMWKKGRCSATWCGQRMTTSRTSSSFRRRKVGGNLMSLRTRSWTSSLRQAVTAVGAIAVGALLAGCNGGGSTSPQLPTATNAQSSARFPSRTAEHEKLPRYTIVDLGTLGGTFSQADSLNNRGSVAGFSTLRGDQSVHAFLWQHGVTTDLSTLGGPNSFSPELPAINESDAVTGFSDMTTPDPNEEDACGFGTQLICRPFVWQKGVITALITLGGNNAQGNAINNRGEVIGTSETRVRNTCASLFLFHFKAAIWEKDHVEGLAPLSGDSDTLGGAINDRGEAVGTSGTCLNASHAVLLRDGAILDLGNLGGTGDNLSSDINSRGEVVGESNIVGDAHHHAFLWRRGAMSDLGTLPGDVDSSANSTNNNGQIAGFSFDASGNPRGVLWQDGLIADFNALIPASSGLFVLEALGINDRGQVAGFAVATATGQVHAFLATPCDRDHADTKHCDDRVENATALQAQIKKSPKVILPENVQKMLRMTRWYPAREFGP
jgi:probable HAF family extracellular repeat protein